MLFTRSKPLAKPRHSGGIDLLKITAVFLILFFHVGFEVRPAAISEGNRLFMAFSGSFGIYAVDVFFVIAAYFLIESGFRKDRFLSYLFVVLFFIVYQSLLFGVDHAHEVNQTGFEILGQWFLRAFIYGALLTNIFWFASVFLFLNVFFPFVVKQLDSKLPDRALPLFLAHVLIFLAVFNFINTRTNLEEPIFFLGVYLLVYTLKRLHFAPKAYFTLPGFFLLYAAVALSRFFQPGLPPALRTLLDFTTGNISTNSGTMLLLALLAFYGVKDLPLPPLPAISYLNRGSFAVYLIHANPLFSLMTHLYNRAFPVLFHFDPLTVGREGRFIPIVLALAGFVYVFGTLVGLLLAKIYPYLKRQAEPNRKPA
jgi:hypothetical protein